MLINKNENRNNILKKEAVNRKKILKILKNIYKKTYIKVKEIYVRYITRRKFK